MNGYFIIPGIVYTKLQTGVTHDRLGQDTEVKLIQFLAQFGYATRKSPTVQLHAAHTHYCSDVNEMKYIQGCDGIQCILPVTLFLYCSTMHAPHGGQDDLILSAIQAK